MKLNIDEVINFYDCDSNARKHSNSVKIASGEEMAFALMSTYFISEGWVVTKLPGPCTPGRRDGRRLDGWIHIKNDSDSILYQVEIKSWSRHGFGEKRGEETKYYRSASEIDMKEYRRNSWETPDKSGGYWDSVALQFRVPELNKVLTEMSTDRRRTEKGWENVEWNRKLPLACVWQALSTTGKCEAFFKQKLQTSEWPEEVHVFSMSNYLRSIPASVKYLELDMPILEERMDYFHKLFEN